MVYYRPSGHGSVVKATTTIIGQKMRYSSQRIWNVNVAAVKDLRKPLRGVIPANRIEFNTGVTVTTQHVIVSLPPASLQRFFSGLVERKEDEISTTPPPSLSYFQRIVSTLRTTLQRFTSSDVVSEQSVVTIVPTSAVKDSASSFSGDPATAKIEPTEIPFLNDFVIKDGTVQLDKPASESVEPSPSGEGTAAVESGGDDPSSQRKMDFIRSKMAPLLTGSYVETESKGVVPVIPTTMVVPKVNGSHVDTAPKVVAPVIATTMVVPKVDPPLIVVPVAYASTAVSPKLASLNVPEPREKQHPDTVSTINLSETISNLISHQNAPVVPLPLHKPLQPTSKPRRVNQSNEASDVLSSRVRSDFHVVPEMPFHLPEVNAWQQLPQQPKATKVKPWKAQRLRKQQQKKREKQRVEQQGATPQEKIAAFAVTIPNAQYHVSSNPPRLPYNTSKGGGVRRNTPQALDPQAIHLLRSQLVEQVNNSRANAVQKQMSSNTQSTSNATSNGLNLNSVGQNPAVNVFRHRPKVDILNHIRSRFPAKASVPTLIQPAQPNPIIAQSAQQNPLNAIFAAQQQQSFQPQFDSQSSSALSDSVLSTVRDSDLPAQLKSQLSETELSSPLTTNISTAASMNDVSFDRRNSKYTDAMERIRSRLPRASPFDVEPNISSVPIFEPIPIQSCDAPQPLISSPHTQASDNSGVAKSLPFDRNTKFSESSQKKLQHLKSSSILTDERNISSSSINAISPFDIAGGPSHDNDFIAKLRSRLAAQHKPQEPAVGLPTFPDGDSAAVNDTSSSIYVNAMDRIRSKLPKGKVYGGMEHQSRPQEHLHAISGQPHDTTSVTPQHLELRRHNDQTVLDSPSVSNDIATSLSHNSDTGSTQFNSDAYRAQLAQSEHYGSFSFNLSNANSDNLNDVTLSANQQSLVQTSGSVNSPIDSTQGKASDSFDDDAFTRLKSRLMSHQDPQNVDNLSLGVDAFQADLNDTTAVSDSSVYVNVIDVLRSKFAKNELKVDLGQESSPVYSAGDTSEGMNSPTHAQQFGSLTLNSLDSAGNEASNSINDEAFTRLKSRLPFHTDPQSKNPVEPGVQGSPNNVDVNTTSADTLRRLNVIDRLRSQLPKGIPGLEVQERSSASSDMNSSCFPNQTSFDAIDQVPCISKEEAPRQSTHSFPPSSSISADQISVTFAPHHEDRTTERVSLEPPARPVHNVSRPVFENSGQSEHLPFSYSQSSGSEDVHAANDSDALRKLRATMDNSYHQKEPLKQTLAEQLFDGSLGGQTDSSSTNYSGLERLRARLPNWGHQIVPPSNAAKLDSRRTVHSINDSSDDDSISKLRARLAQTDATVDSTFISTSGTGVGFDHDGTLLSLHHGGSSDDAIAKLQSRLGRTDPIVDSTSVPATLHPRLEPESSLQTTGSMETLFGDDTIRNLRARLGQRDTPIAPSVPKTSLNSWSMLDERTSENSGQGLHFYSSTISHSSAPGFPTNVDVMDVMPSRQNDKASTKTAGAYSSMSHDVKAPRSKSKEWKNQFVPQKKVKNTMIQQKSKGVGQNKDILDRISAGLSELIPLAKPQVAAESRAPTIEPKAMSALESLRHKFLAAKGSDSSAQSTQPGVSSMNQWSQRATNLLKTSEHLPSLPNPSLTLDRIFDTGSTRPLIQPQRERALQHQRFRFQDQSSSATGKQYNGSFSSSSSNDKPPLSEIIRNMQYQNSLMSQSEGADGQSYDGSASFDSLHPPVIPKWRQSWNPREQQPMPPPTPSSPPPPPAPRKPTFIDPKKQPIALPSFQISLTEASQLFREKTLRLLEVLESLGETRPEGIGEEDNESWMLSKETLELMAMEIGQLIEESSAATPSLSDEDLLLMRRAAADAPAQAIRPEERDYKSFPTRPPVVCIMGHVDHGKTTLMDALRRRAARESSADVKQSKGKDKKKDKGKKDKGKKANGKSGDIAGTEAGGITQVISAFEVPLIEQENATASVTFLDTPGHAAFTAMRQSGSDAADIIVLVIAADDGVSEQTVEILNFYKSIVKGAGSGGISLVVAMNKIDKPGVDVEEATRRIQGQLLQHGILTEGMPTSEGITEYGPAVQMVPVSGLTGRGLDDLIDGLVLQSEMMDLRAPTDAGAEGIVMDARVDKGVGIVVDCIVRWGSLHKGDIVVSGTNKGKVRLLKDVQNAPVPQGLPSQPVRIVGFDSLPKAGDPFVVVASEEAADELLSRRKAAEGATDAAPPAAPLSDAELQSAGRHMMTSAWKDALETKYGLHPDGADAPVRIPVVIKADADGTLAAIRDALVQLGVQSAQKVVIDPIKVGVGPLLPSEIQMAQECSASIVCFNIQNDAHLVRLAEENQVRILQSDIIYTLLDAAKLELARHLPEVPVEMVQGRAKVLATYDIGGLEDKVAGLKVLEGTLFKDQTVATKGVRSAPCQYRVLRNGVAVATGLSASSLKHFKEDVTEVLRGKECGISLGGHQDYAVGDEVECFAVELRPATL
jgi:small GTP-binding protein